MDQHYLSFDFKSDVLLAFVKIIFSVFKCSGIQNMLNICIYRMCPWQVMLVVW